MKRNHSSWSVLSVVTLAAIVTSGLCSAGCNTAQIVPARVASAPSTELQARSAGPATLQSERALRRSAPAMWRRSSSDPVARKL